MARSRNIKPGFFLNEHLVELAFEYRLLFAGLWTLVDREGRMEYRPKKIKMAVFPADNVDVEAGLNELNNCNLIKIYENKKNKYIQVVNFNKHQNPHVNEKSTNMPAPRGKKSGACTVLAPDKSGCNPADSLLPITDSLNPHSDSRIPDSLNPKEESRAKALLSISSEINDDPSVNKFTEKDLATAMRMFHYIQLVSPKSKTPNFEKWADDIRLMRERDNYTEDEIVSVFLFANNDSFWRSNILSTAKLRDKFPALHAKMKAREENGKSGASNHKPSRSERADQEARDYIEKHGLS